MSFLAPWRRRSAQTKIEFVQRGASWLTQTLSAPVTPPTTRLHRLIERRALLTQQAGPRPIWNGYDGLANYFRSATKSRTSDEVRTSPHTGRFYSWLVTKRRPGVVVEFGTAFGVSGMYWLAGIAEVAKGHLFTFEPNADWASLARPNLAAISSEFTLTIDTFESAAGRVLGDKGIDMALIDAIHTCEFVERQFAIVRQRLSPGGIVLFDDIDFSDDMRECWRRMSARPEIAASATIDGRVGIIEMRP